MAKERNRENGKFCDCQVTFSVDPPRSDKDKGDICPDCGKPCLQEEYQDSKEEE